MMTCNELSRVIKSCRVMIAASEAAIARLKEETRDENSPVICGVKETAAARRASMDLTRVLADLRRRS